MKSKGLKISHAICGSLLLASLVACSSKKDPQQPEETRESLMTLRAQPMSECPDISGVYSEALPTDTSVKSAEKQTIQISKLGNKKYHYRETDGSEKSDFVSYMIDQYLFDDGGYVADGLIHDKTAGVRDVMRGLLNGFSSTIMRATLAALGIDMDAEIKKMNIDDMKVAYVASCTSDTVKIQHVFADTALKYVLTQQSSGDLSVTIYLTENGGPVVKNVAVYVLERSDEKPALEKTNAENNVDRGPETLVVRVVNTQEFTLDEPIYMSFTKISGNLPLTHYYLGVAHFGQTDDWFFDDVTVETFNKNRINLDFVAKKVYLGKDIEVGTLTLQDTGEYMIHFNNVKIDGSTLVIGK